MNNNNKKTFWEDANMVLDYRYFNAFISLDITYCTDWVNKTLCFLFKPSYKGAIIFCWEISALFSYL